MNQYNLSIFHQELVFLHVQQTILEIISQDFASYNVITIHTQMIPYEIVSIIVLQDIH